MQKSIQRLILVFVCGSFLQVGVTTMYGAESEDRGYGAEDASKDTEKAEKSRRHGHPTPTPTITPTVSPTVSPTISPTVVPTVVPTVSPTPTTTLTPTPSPTITPSPLSGANLYQSNCAGCHGPLATSSKRGATAARIQSAIQNNIGGMGYLSGLSAAAIDAIATALK